MWRLTGEQQFVGNGAPGADGRDGLTPTVEPLDRELYPYGGVKITRATTTSRVKFRTAPRSSSPNGEPGANGLPGLAPLIEPAGDEECPYGGVKVTPRDYDEESRLVERTSYFACNGAPGEKGDKGDTGAAGAAGKDGAPGATSVVYVDRPVQVSTGAVAGQTATNKVSRRVVKLQIVARRGQRVRGLRVLLEGKRAQVKRTGARRGQATLDLRGLPRGAYAAQVTASVNGRTVTRKHLYRVVYGNPKGAAKAGLNAGTCVRL